MFTSLTGGSGAAADLAIDAGATVRFGSTQHLDSLNISTGGTVQMMPAGGPGLDTNTLSVNGTLDFTDNDMIVNNPSANTAMIDTLQEQVGQWVNNNSSGGAIEISTAATDGTTIGIAPAAVGVMCVDAVATANPTTFWVYGQTSSGNADWQQATAISEEGAGTNSADGQALTAVSIQLPATLPANSIYLKAHQEKRVDPGAKAVVERAWAVLAVLFVIFFGKHGARSFWVTVDRSARSWESGILRDLGTTRYCVGSASEMAPSVDA